MGGCLQKVKGEIWARMKKRKRIQRKTKYTFVLPADGKSLEILST